MIVIFHQNQKVTGVETADLTNENFGGRAVVGVLLELSERFPDKILVWCHQSMKKWLNKTQIPLLFHHRKFLFSYHSPDKNFFDDAIGYVEDSPYVHVLKKVTYGTWQMSGTVGAAYGSLITAISGSNIDGDLDYFLNSAAKLAVPHGLMCFSEPSLLTGTPVFSATQASTAALYKFVRQHYKVEWIFLLFFNLLVYRRKLTLWGLFLGLFQKRKHFDSTKLDVISIQSTKSVIDSQKVDVLIPTIGRKAYLHEVFKQLASQTLKPANVIVIEQNPLPGSTSDLDFISDSWPFAVKHRFIHTPGACNARNIGLALIESEVCFLADDDIIFGDRLLEEAIGTMKMTGSEVVLMACLNPDQPLVSKAPVQFAAFGAGHAFVKSSVLKGLEFNMGYEFGFGEDADFGMQLRRRGFPVLYASSQKITHLKAPIGGFRTKPALRWKSEPIQPKPSPTVMLYHLLYDTPSQLRGYKTTLFFKTLSKNPLKVFSSVKTFRKKWATSVKWANVLRAESGNGGN